jgi:hypothetical protein
VCRAQWDIHRQIASLPRSAPAANPIQMDTGWAWQRSAGLRPLDGDAGVPLIFCGARIASMVTVRGGHLPMEWRERDDRVHSRVRERVIATTRAAEPDTSSAPGREGACLGGSMSTALLTNRIVRTNPAKLIAICMGNPRPLNCEGSPLAVPGTGADPSLNRHALRRDAEHEPLHRNASTYAESCGARRRGHGDR